MVDIICNFRRVDSHHNAAARQYRHLDIFPGLGGAGHDPDPLPGPQSDVVQPAGQFTSLFVKDFPGGGFPGIGR